jgi:hypothetical protein
MFRKILRDGPRSIAVEIVLPVSIAVTTAARCACTGTGKTAAPLRFPLQAAEAINKGGWCMEFDGRKMPIDHTRQQRMRIMENAEFRS